MVQNKQSGSGAGSVLAVFTGIILLALIGGGIYWLTQRSASPKADSEEAAKTSQPADFEELIPQAAQLPPADPVCDYITRSIADNVVLPGGADFRKLRGTEWIAPIPHPALTMKQVRQAAEEAVQAEIEAHFSPEYQQEFRQKAAREAAEKFRMLTKGDSVDFVIRNGVGVGSQVTGKLTEVAAGYIRVGSRLITRMDIPQEVQARLWQNSHEEAIKEYCSQRELALQADLKFARIDAEKKLYPDFYRKNGYVPDIFNPVSSPDKVVDAHWISKRELYDKIQRTGF
ncbi:MAG: hypothetical protein J6S21_05615 [Victivallales bacterium]|nr:hypothetical protein [Victivallales bacterium]